LREPESRERERERERDIADGRVLFEVRVK
jgi:hypothetical protein